MKNIFLCALLMIISVAEVAHRIGQGRTLFCRNTYDIPMTVSSWTDVDDESDNKKLNRLKTARDSNITLDFFVAGFPKCGTTTLLDAFRDHPETVVPATETNILTTPGTDEEIYTKIMNELKLLAPKTANVKRGIKNPIGLGAVSAARWRAIEYLECLFPETVSTSCFDSSISLLLSPTHLFSCVKDLIFGLRHPVLYFQSFYNYRVWNYHSGEGPPELFDGTIPSAKSLLAESWSGVSVESARFEETLKHLVRNPNSNGPLTQFKVFLYAIEQIRDSNNDRKAAFRKELASFLGLKQPIPPLPHSNQQTKRFNETIDICHDKYDKIRQILVKNGKRTQQWIREEFLCSPTVSVANEEHFLELLETFGRDPCRESIL